MKDSSRGATEKFGRFRPNFSVNLREQRRGPASPSHKIPIDMGKYKKFPPQRDKIILSILNIRV